VLYHTGVSVQLSAPNYITVEGSSVLITVLADVPAGRDFLILLVPFTISTTGAASGKCHVPGLNSE